MCKDQFLVRMSNRSIKMGKSHHEVESYSRNIR